MLEQKASGLALWRCLARADRAVRHEKQDQDRREDFKSGEHVETRRGFSGQVLQPADN